MIPTRCPPPRPGSTMIKASRRRQPRGRRQRGRRPSTTDGDELPLDRDARRARGARQVLIANADAETVKLPARQREGEALAPRVRRPRRRRARRRWPSRATSTPRSCATASSPSSTRQRRCRSRAATRSAPMPDAPIVPPNLMQRRVAVCVREKRRFGNWSGMGAGKTLSAILATRVVGVGPHGHLLPERGRRRAGTTRSPKPSRARGRGQDLGAALEGSAREQRRATSCMNYEQFQQPDSERNLVAFLDRNVIDFIVIDEIHYAKQREAGSLDEQAQAPRPGARARGGEEEQRPVRARHVRHAGHQHAPRGQEPRRDDHRPSPRRSRDRARPCRTACASTSGSSRSVRAGSPTTRSSSRFARRRSTAQPALERDPCGGRGTVLELEQVLTELRLPTILAEHRGGREGPHLHALCRRHRRHAARRARHGAGYASGMLTGDTDDERSQGVSRQATARSTCSSRRAASARASTASSTSATS